MMPYCAARAASACWPVERSPASAWPAREASLLRLLSVAGGQSQRALPIRNEPAVGISIIGNSSLLYLFMTSRRRRAQGSWQRRVLMWWTPRFAASVNALRAPSTRPHRQVDIRSIRECEGNFPVSYRTGAGHIKLCISRRDRRHTPHAIRYTGHCPHSRASRRVSPGLYTYPFSLGPRSRRAGAS